MPETLNGLQKLHEERWEQMISVLKFYTSTLSALPSAIEDAVSELKEKTETQANLDEDLQEYVDAVKEAQGTSGGDFKALSVEINDFFVSESKEDEEKAEAGKQEDDKKDDDGDDE